MGFPELLDTILNWNESNKHCKSERFIPVVSYLSVYLPSVQASKQASKHEHTHRECAQPRCLGRQTGSRVVSSSCPSRPASRPTGGATGPRPVTSRTNVWCLCQNQIKYNVRMMSVPEQIKCAYDVCAGTNQMYMSRLCQTKLKCVRGILVTSNQVTCLSTYLCQIKSNVRVRPSQSLSNVR